MDKIIIILCEVLASSLNIIIGLLFLVEIGLAIISGKMLYSLKKNVDGLYRFNVKSQGKRVKEGKHKLSQTNEVVRDMDYERFDEIRVEYQRTERWYSLFTLIIQLFPLLGILGTVAGLYIAITSEMDIYVGVKFALSSTVYGILFSVFAKIVDIIFVAWFVNGIDKNMERYEKNYMVYTEEAKQEDRD